MRTAIRLLTFLSLMAFLGSSANTHGQSVMFRWQFDPTSYTVSPSEEIVVTGTLFNTSAEPLAILGVGVSFTGDLQKVYNFTWKHDLFMKYVDGGDKLDFVFGTLRPINGYAPPGVYYADPARIGIFETAQPSGNTFQITVVPEPGSMSLLLFGLGAGTLSLAFSRQSAKPAAKW